MNTEQLCREQDRVLAIVFEHKAALAGNALLILGGGTALARYYLNHRVSYDLDFFLDQGFDPALLRRRLAQAGLPGVNYLGLWATTILAGGSEAWWV